MSGTLWRRLVILAFFSLALPEHGLAFRLYVPRTSPQQNISYAPFEPYEQGFVGYFGQPTNYQRERINEGGDQTAEFPRQVQAGTGGCNGQPPCPPSPLIIPVD